MRLAILSHSNIAERQVRFFREVSKYCDVLLVTPYRWGNLVSSQERIEGNSFEIFPNYVSNNGNIYKYEWNQKVKEKLKDWKPTHIYCVAEWCSDVARQVYEWSKEVNCKLILFSWENIKQPSPYDAVFLRSVDLVICGNDDAVRICNEAGAKTARLVHVGVDSELFKDVSGGVKPYDVVFIGRQTYEKGIQYVKRLAEDGFKVLICEGVPYERIPENLSSAKICVVPSLTTPTWKEQFPSAIAESLACGTPVVAFDSGSMKEHYGGCPAVFFVKEGDYAEFEARTQALLDNDAERQKVAEIGRVWVLQHFSNEVIAKKLMEVLN